MGVKAIRILRDAFYHGRLEQKKMIACHLFKRIEAGRDHKFPVELNTSYRQFCSEWGDGGILAGADIV